MLKKEDLSVETGLWVECIKDYAHFIKGYEYRLFVMFKSIYIMDDENDLIKFHSHDIKEIFKIANSN